MTEAHAATVLDTLNQAVSEIVSKVTQPVADLDLFGPRSRDQVLTWNQRVPPRVSRCAHDLIKERNLKQPDAPAVCAWDGQFTYAELDEKASELADHLAQNCGVGPDIFVPVYFEKSKYTTVALLAITKAGGAFVQMDPSHPVQRLKDICQDVSAPLVVTSEAKAVVAAELGPRVVVVGDHRFGWDTTPNMSPVSRVTPSDPIYAVSNFQLHLYPYSLCLRSTVLCEDYSLSYNRARALKSLLGYLDRGMLTLDWIGVHFRLNG